MTSSTPQAARGKSVRIEYSGFRNVGDHREFDLAVHDMERVVRFRFRIALASLDGRTIRLQDGPDACYQVLLRMLATGEPLAPQTITLGPDELALYRAAHTPAARVSTPRPQQPEATGAAPLPRRPAFQPAFRKTAEPPPPPPRLPYDAGQRVQHEVFGTGITTSVLPDETVVWFDDHGRKTFRTSMLRLEILSEGGMWELGPRNKVRLRTPAS